MLFTTNTTLVRRIFSNNTFKLLCCGIAIVNILAVPSYAAKGNPAFDAAEYDEWGLDYPNKPNPKTPATPTASQPVTTQSPVTQSTQPTGGNVPQDIAASIKKTAVHVIVFYPDGKHMVLPGWIVDTQRRIIMTFNLLKGAEKIQVAYPQVTDVPDDKVSGSNAVVLNYENDMEFVYLQANSMPETLASLTVAQSANSHTANRPVVVAQNPTTPTTPTAPQPPISGGHNNGGFNTGNGSFNGGQQGGFQPPAQSQNQLVGQWYLQDTVNGTQIQIGVIFNAQGGYIMHVNTIDSYGKQNQDSILGTYTVEGNILILNSKHGEERSNFRFENGLLYVQVVADGTTLIFQPAS